MITSSREGAGGGLVAEKQGWRLVSTEGSAPPDWGYTLPIVYVVWAFVVVAMYPSCRWFAALKQRRSDAWLSYV